MAEKFKDKKKIVYYATKALAAEEAGDRAAYLMNLKIAAELMEKIEGKSAEDILEEVEIMKKYDLFLLLFLAK